MEANAFMKDIRKNFLKKNMVYIKWNTGGVKELIIIEKALQLKYR